MSGSAIMTEHDIPQSLIYPHYLSRSIGSYKDIISQLLEKIR
jgi:hypothetical protein